MDSEGTNPVHIILSVVSSFTLLLPIWAMYRLQLKFELVSTCICLLSTLIFLLYLAYCSSDGYLNVEDKYLGMGIYDWMKIAAIMQTFLTTQIWTLVRQNESRSDDEKSWGACFLLIILMYENSIGELDFMFPILLTMVIPLLRRVTQHKQFDIETRYGILMATCWFLCYVFYGVACFLEASTDLMIRMIFFHIGAVFYSGALYVTLQGINVQKRRWHISLVTGEAGNGLQDSIVPGQIVGKPLSNDDDLPQTDAIITGQALAKSTKAEHKENEKPEKGKKDMKK